MSSFRKLNQFYFDQGSSKKNLDGAGNETKENRNKGKITPQYIKNEKPQIIYEYVILEYFLLGRRGNLQNQQIKNEENTTLACSSIFYMRVDVSKVEYRIFVRSQWCGKYKKVCMERML